MATKYCTQNGTWFHHPALKTKWTDFQGCLIQPDISAALEHIEHGERLQLIMTIGYGVSLCSLVLAVVIMCCSKLKSKSNTLHVNLFLAFILRAVLSFAKNLLFVNNIGLEKDIMRLEGRILFIQEGTHWECRLLMSIFMYAICVSHMCIFVEGLYLHMLIYRTLITERNGVKPYIILAWVLPLAILIPWVVVRITVDNVLCWNMTENKDYIWIHHGPLLAAVSLNFLFFMNICRVLFCRLRSSQRHTGKTKYRQLAKFILVLIPLFGVIYIVLAVVFPLGYSERFHTSQMYVEQTYNAFQGFLLALLFCFLNEEVHGEIRSIWSRQTRRRDSVATKSFVLSSFKRTSLHNRASSSTGPNNRSSTRLSNSDSFEIAKRESWAPRFKRRLLRFLGLSRKERNIVRPPTPPFIVKHNCSTENKMTASDDFEIKLKLRGKVTDDDDDLLSSG
ncbi:glucagon peptide 2 receptor, partial [Biomphalaria glabrata]